MSLEKYFLKKLKSIKPPQKPSIWLAEDYVGGGTSKLKYLNLKTPEVRSILKENLPLYEEDFETQLSAFEKVWFDSKVYEVKVLALYWLESQPTSRLVPYAVRISKWAKAIDNWGHSDCYCGTVARIFEQAPKSLLKTFKSWNKHKNPWFRRVSMVGLVYYSRTRKTHPSFEMMSTFVRPHFTAPEYYVQKAVGWTIREMYNIYPSETIRFIQDNLYRLTPVAWVAASEKLDLRLKAKLVKQRSENRKNVSATSSVR